MKLYIKNMVCNRCKMVVRETLEKQGLAPKTVELGEIEIENQPSKNQLENLQAGLKHFGFELIDDKKGRIIEKIKNQIVAMVHHSEENPKTNLSAVISGKLKMDYNYLSNLFSEVEGTTIEKYYINQRIEKVKELLIYDELSLSGIADELGYSSVAYLSNQFKKITGLTPTFYKGLKDHKRRNIEDL
ncbi:MAG: AraC family transcriptional regulator [Bacteroidota bacterium]|nr:AraC family transcriptional regulator [Bacteroidota bacterium]MDP4212726.1 AraC family transcriptional regulator [Bacteroidota bacterium]MDP4250530.1 AraC family transcriptional regulator [Bacteroidota bacterium]